MSSPALARLWNPLLRWRRHVLTRWEHSELSQNGEDGVIEEILRRVGEGRRYFVEFGAGPGVEGNCVRLADVAGWRGLFMEADADGHDALAAKYRDVPGVRTRRERISPQNVVGVLRDEGVPRDLDVLSIDIDGNDYWVWQTLLDDFHPRVVVIEYNATLGTEAQLVQPLRDEPWDQTAYFGASIRALVRLGASAGYRLVHTDSHGVNAFFVAAERSGRFAPERRVPLHGPAFTLPHDPLQRRYTDLS